MRRLALWCALAMIAALTGHGGAAPAQGPEPAAGICDGHVCGPSGAFHPERFPTLTPIDWEAFPVPILRETIAPGPGGRTIFVAEGGDDTGPGTAELPLASLAQAAIVARPGDVVWVAEGVYALGAPDFYDGLVLQTPGVAWVAERIGGAILVPASAETKVGIIAEADDLLIDGFVVRGFASVGIVFGRVGSPQRHLRLQHLEVAHCAEGIASVYGGDGSRPLIDGMLIHDVRLHALGLIALQCGEGPCDNLRWEALDIDLGAGTDVGNSAADAIALESGSNVVVFNAHITGAAGDGIDLKTATGAVANVIVHDIGRNGIKLWEGGDIANALVYNTGADSAIVLHKGAFRIVNTIVARHAWGGRAYTLTAGYDDPEVAGRLEIANSVFYQNAGPVWASPAMSLVVTHTIFTQSANDLLLVWRDIEAGPGGVPFGDLAAAGATIDAVEDADPGFADPDAGDFSWGPDSPLLDSGTDALPLPDFDLFGQPRKAGAAVDRGPVEWQG